LSVIGDGLYVYMAGHERHLGVARRLDGATGDGPAGRRRATSGARAEAVCVTRCLDTSQQLAI